MALLKGAEHNESGEVKLFYSPGKAANYPSIAC